MQTEEKIEDYYVDAIARLALAYDQPRQSDPQGSKRMVAITHPAWWKAYNVAEVLYRDKYWLLSIERRVLHLHYKNGRSIFRIVRDVCNEEHPKTLKKRNAFMDKFVGDSLLWGGKIEKAFSFKHLAYRSLDDLVAVSEELDRIIMDSTGIRFPGVDDEVGEIVRLLLCGYELVDQPLSYVHAQIDREGIPVERETKFAVFEKKEDWIFDDYAHPREYCKGRRNCHLRNHDAEVVQDMIHGVRDALNTGAVEGAAGEEDEWAVNSRNLLRALEHRKQIIEEYESSLTG